MPWCRTQSLLPQEASQINVVLDVSRQALHEAALRMVRNMSCLSGGKEMLFKKFAKSAIDSKGNSGIQMKEKAAGSETPWTSPHIYTLQLLKVGF